MARERSTRFVRASGKLLDATVDVTAHNRTGTKQGSVVESGGAVASSLPCSIQPRESLPARTVMGLMPDTSHMMYCAAEDADGTLFDIHMGDWVEETTDGRATRKFEVRTEPHKFPDFDTGGWHHLEIELKEDVYA